MKAPSREDIDKVIAEQVRPLIRADGGDIAVERLGDDGAVYVRLLGRCAGCPGATFTLAELVERCLVDEVENVKRVVLLPWKLVSE